MRRSTPILLVLLTLGCAAEPVPPPEMPALGEPLPLPDDPRRQFDFWLGEWHVENKQLRRGRWLDSGTAGALIQPVVGGNAVLEQWTGELGGDPLIGFSLRAYDPILDKWVIWLNWHGGRPTGFSEMHGVRNGERIEQFPPDDDRHLRYSFSRLHEKSCRWDEARSEDGETWITDWVMQFSRREAPRPVDASDAPIVRPPEEAGAFRDTRTLDFLIGAWEGSARARRSDGSWEEGSARARVTSMIEGFGLLQFLDTSWGEKTLAAIGWDTREKGWLAVRVDSGPDGPLRMTGESVSRTAATFHSAELRESWSCPDTDTCSWRREASSDGGRTWTKALEARLARLR